MTPPPASTRPKLSRRRRLLFGLVPLLGLLLGGELLARVLRDPWCLSSYRALRVDLMRRGYPAVPDPQLGYSPRPGFVGQDNHWGTRVTIDADGCRDNGVTPPAGRPLVAVGDSFAFGDQVNDDDTWAAQLELGLHRRVVNGGVFGYSLTQSVLRAEALIERMHPEWLLLSYIPDDLPRCEFSKRYTPVPWFDIQGGQLVLRNVPVAETSAPDELAARAFKDVLGHSALLDAILAQTCPHWWVTDQKEVRVHPLGFGDQLGLLLIDRIAAHCRAHDCRLLVLQQGERSTPAGDAVLARARTAGAATLDLIAEFLAAAAADPTVRGKWFAGHMTRAGNGWVAERVAETVRQPR